MARVINFIDEDGYWWNSNPHPLGNIIVLEEELIIGRIDTPKLSQRLRIALRVVVRGKNAKGRSK